MSKEILVTAIISTYKSERFMAGCLDDLERQTIADQLEIIVIDSCSPENEGDIVRDFQSRYDNIVYLRTDQREGLYTAWNRAVVMAKGKYLTNANTDDRHHPSSFAKLVTALERSPRCVLAYHDQLTSAIENEEFETCLPRKTRRIQFPDFSHETLILGCLTGSQPMWRKSVHNEHGLFSEHYRIAADYEFWVRIAQTHDFIHVPEVLGLFYDSPETMSGANNRFLVDKETLEIQLEYIKKQPWSGNAQLRKRLAQTIFQIGYHHVEILRNMTNAKLFLWAAWRLHPTNLNLAKSYILRGLLKSHWRLD